MATIEADTKARPARSWPARIAHWAVLAAFPLSLTSPGTTVVMALAAICGLVMWWRAGELPRDIAVDGSMAAGCYLLLLSVDLINGGGTNNLLGTGVNYLPVLALAPLSFAIRSSGISMEAIDRALQATILIALAISVFSFIDGEQRPGGLNLNPIPYGLAVLLSASLLLWRALEGRPIDGKSVAISVSATIPILLTGSKIVWACALVAYAGTYGHWIATQRRWKPAVSVLIGGLAGIAVGYHFFARSRFEPLWVEIAEFTDRGVSQGGTFGRRAEMAVSGWRAFLDQPIFGYGLHERMEAVLAHSTPGGPDLSIHNHLHNDYITHLVSYGIFGAIFLAAYWLLLVRQAAFAPHPAYRRFGYTVAVILLIYMSAEVAFNMDPVSGPMAVIFALLLGSRAGLGKRDEGG
ncbi:MAG: O-antigen ligase family protein [Rhizobiaceae bacterium]|nr:O-antigen ligase family protein [Rhizobiaceae bacterium]